MYRIVGALCAIHVELPHYGLGVDTSGTLAAHFEPLLRESLPVSQATQLEEQGMRKSTHKYTLKYS